MVDDAYHDEAHIRDIESRIVLNGNEFAARNLLERATAIWRLHEVAVPSHLDCRGAPAAPSDLQRIAAGSTTAGVNEHG